MIEVEKKFSPGKAQIEGLTRGADFLMTKIFTDIYFDTSDYSLTRKDIWLRKRAGQYELKVSMNEGVSMSQRQADKYKELETETEIKDALGIPQEKTLGTALEEAGFEPFCSITTTRTEYKIGDFKIDINFMDFGYKIVEIELMVGSEDQRSVAAESILAFAKNRGLETGYVMGKVIEFLRRNNPEHFQALVEAGVV